MRIRFRPGPFHRDRRSRARAKQGRASDKCVDSLFGSRRLSGSAPPPLLSFLAAACAQPTQTSAKIPAVLQGLHVEFPGRQQAAAPPIAGRQARRAHPTPPPPESPSPPDPCFQPSSPPPSPRLLSPPPP